MPGRKRSRRVSRRRSQRRSRRPSRRSPRGRRYRAIRYSPTFVTQQGFSQRAPPSNHHDPVAILRDVNDLLTEIALIASSRPVTSFIIAKSLLQPTEKYLMSGNISQLTLHFSKIRQIYNERAGDDTRTRIVQKIQDQYHKYVTLLTVWSDVYPDETKQQIVFPLPLPDDMRERNNSPRESDDGGEEADMVPPPPIPPPPSRNDQ